jgi:phage N-6-adenine-methyltransferase
MIPYFNTKTLQKDLFETKIDVVSFESERAVQPQETYPFVDLTVTPELLDFEKSQFKGISDWGEVSFGHMYDTFDNNGERVTIVPVRKDFVAGRDGAQWFFRKLNNTRQHIDLPSLTWSVDYLGKRDKVRLNDTLWKSEREKLENHMRIYGYFGGLMIRQKEGFINSQIETEVWDEIIIEEEYKDILDDGLKIIGRDRLEYNSVSGLIEEFYESLEWIWDLEKGSKNVSNTFTSKDQAWRTPDYIYDYFDKIYNFNFDAAASKANARTRRYLTKQDDALSSSWCRKGRRIWLNPPYSRNLYPWIKKAYEESKKGCLVAVLIYSRTDTKWWHDFVIPHAYKVHFIRPRIKFLDSKTGKKKGSATAPSCLIVFKPNRRRSFLVEGDVIRDGEK